MTAIDTETFVSELKHWRDVRGLSQMALAERMAYDRSYISKIESGRERPSSDFAARADSVLEAGGALRRAFRDCERQRQQPSRSVQTNEPSEPSGNSLVVEHDDAQLTYDGKVYTAHQRRQLRNIGNEPVTRYLIRISVDRFPGSPLRSNQLYRDNPLTWEELQLEAWLNDDEPLTWTVHHDRDAFKELWLLLENQHRRFPLYPGESAWINYRYKVSDTKWGDWFQRAVRLPTRRLSVSLNFPLSLNPVVWGLETSNTAQPLPLRTAIRRDDTEDVARFSWSTDNPPLHARYRLEWEMRGLPERYADPSTPSEVMASLGIIQRGDSILTQPAKPFHLPSEQDDATRVIAELYSVAERASRAHQFGKGIGLAAPQIGIDRAAAIVRPPDGSDLILLINPKVVDESSDSRSHYEGCLSFFDFRGLVPRSVAIEVEHQDFDGTRRITRFTEGIARLVAHEIDHLNGVLYTDRMDNNEQLVPVEEYQGTGQSWEYR